MKQMLLILGLSVIGGALVFFFLGAMLGSDTTVENTPAGVETVVTETTPTEDQEETVAEEAEIEEIDETETLLGTSVDGNSITAYHFGEGEEELLFVGGIHGGYSWNTASVAYELIDYLTDNEDAVPDNLTVSVIPVLNPDGLAATVGTSSRFAASAVPSSLSDRIPGRFNANEVDLNRNFDCEWAPESTWQNRSVSGGSAAFSEPEAAALRDYVEANDITAAVVWYAAAGGVFTSNCRGGVLPETTEIANLYAEAADYEAFAEFDFYEITGDAVNWLAKEGIPAISVLLSTHEDIEWSKNRAGVEALFNFYAE